MTKKEMVKVMYINDTPGFTNGIVGENNNGRIIEVNKEFAQVLTKEGKSNFWVLVQDEDKNEVEDKKPAKKGKK
jgi:hypothetical protein